MGQLAAFDATEWFLVFARVGAILMLVPAFGDESVSPRIRLILALLISLTLQPIVAGHLLPGLEGDALALALVREVAIGLAIGALVRILYLSLATAGAVIAIQAGFSMVTAFDPTMGGQTSTVTRLMSVGALLFLFALNIHHLLIVGVVKSYSFITPEMTTAGRDLAEVAVKAVTWSFAVGLQIAAPFLVFGLVLNVGLGLAARLAPTIQVFFIAQPFMLLVGIALMLICLASGLELWARLFGGTLRAAMG